MGKNLLSKMHARGAHIECIKFDVVRRRGVKGRDKSAPRGGGGGKDKTKYRAEKSGTHRKGSIDMFCVPSTQM